MIPRFRSLFYDLKFAMQNSTKNRIIIIIFNSLLVRDIAQTQIIIFNVFQKNITYAKILNAEEKMCMRTIQWNCQSIHNKRLILCGALLGQMNSEGMWIYRLQVVDIALQFLTKLRRGFRKLSSITMKMIYSSKCKLSVYDADSASISIGPD